MLNSARAFLARHGSLHAALIAGAEVLEVVTQDEFTLDVVARLPREYGEVLVVFDTT